MASRFAETNSSGGQTSGQTRDPLSNSTSSIATSSQHHSRGGGSRAAGQAPKLGSGHRKKRTRTTASFFCSLACFGSFSVVYVLYTLTLGGNFDSFLELTSLISTITLLEKETDLKVMHSSSSKSRSKDKSTKTQTFAANSPLIWTFATPRPNQICSFARALFGHNETAIVQALRDAEQFHLGGGNLKSIQEYLDNNIDETFQLLGLRYHAKTNTNNNNNNKTSMFRKEEEELDRKDKAAAAGRSTAFRILQDLINQDVHTKRGGYNQRQLPGKFSATTVSTTSSSSHKNNYTMMPKALRGGRYVDVIEPVNYDRWRAALGPIGPPCQSLDRIQRQPNKPHYEDKFMCSYHDWSASADAAVNHGNTEKDGGGENNNNYSSCNLISIGSNDQWGFEETVIKQTRCQTHTFDCTIPQSSPKRKPKSDRVHFYPYCIADHDYESEDGRMYKTYHSMLGIAGLAPTTKSSSRSSEAPKLLKMDVEGFEYNVLSSLFASHTDGRDGDDSGSNNNKSSAEAPSPLLLLPEQIVVELHYATRMYDLPWMLRFRQAAEISLLIGHMYLCGGYLPVYVDYNPGCASCLEVLFVKVLC